jgi:hypothetical protein
MPGTGPPCGGAEGVIAMRRIGVIVALGALLSMFGGVLTVSPALAGGRGDGWQVFPLPPTFPVPAAFCGFKIQGTQDVAKVFDKALKTADGSMIFLSTGAAKITFTNPANGKSVTEVTSGPVKEIRFPDGSVTLLMKGHQPNGLTPEEQARFGLPGLFVSAGAVTVSIAPDGTVTSATRPHHILVNVCAALS